MMMMTMMMMMLMMITNLNQHVVESGRKSYGDPRYTVGGGVLTLIL
jgi:hypothetical protein